MDYLEEIIINNSIIKVTRKKIKNLILSINPNDGTARISAPVNLSIKTINAFIQSKLNWLKKQQEKFKPNFTNYQFISGEYHYYQGKSYLLQVIYHKGLNKVMLDEESQCIKLYVVSKGKQALRKTVLYKWYKTELAIKINFLIKKWQAIIGVTINKYTIRLMKSRWGSCNITKKIICLNLELIKKPAECLEYIVVHELIHLLEKRHNKRFYNFMQQFLPTWRLTDKILNTHPRHILTA